MQLNKINDINQSSYSSTYELISKWFNEIGWSTKKATSKPFNRKSFISRKGKHHTKIIWSISHELEITVTAELWKKTPNGGWMYHTSGSDLQTLVNKAASIKKPILITKESLPDPIKFDNEQILIEHGSIINNTCFSSIRIIGIVGLDNKGCISQNIVYTPGEQVWFHISANFIDGSHAQFITDGVVIYALNWRRRGAPRVTSTITRMLSNLTAFDKKMVEFAIDEFFND